MSTGQAIVINLISTNGGSSGYTNSLQIDGSSQTINWQDGSAPSGRGGTSGFDIWSFNIIKTGASSYLVFGSQTYVD